MARKDIITTGAPADGIGVPRTPPRSSPTFEKVVQLERLKKCAETTESARQLIETSKKLTEEAHEIIESARSKRRKAS